MDIQERIKEVKSEYYRKWRERNKDKVKNYQKGYWLRKAMNNVKTN